MAEAEYKNSGDLLPYTSTGAASTAGDIVDLGSGMIGVVQNDLEEDAEGTVAVVGGYNVYKDPADALVFAVGATVGWDNTNKKAVAGGAGDFNIGKCGIAASSSQGFVRVRLNA